MKYLRKFDSVPDMETALENGPEFGTLNLAYDEGTPMTVLTRNIIHVSAFDTFDRSNIYVYDYTPTLKNMSLNNFIHKVIEDHQIESGYDESFWAVEISPYKHSSGSRIDKNEWNRTLNDLGVKLDYYIRIYARIA